MLIKSKGEREYEKEKHKEDKEADTRFKRVIRSGEKSGKTYKKIRWQKKKERG